MSNRFSSYLKLLRHIYGKKVVEKLTYIIPNRGNKLYLKDFTSNLTELLFYKRSTDEGCLNCKMKNLFKEIILKNKTIYNHRIMEFPSWHPNFPLGFENESHAKKIMLIGEDPGPRIRSDLHTAYEFGMLNINPNGTYDYVNFKKLLLTTSEKHYIYDFKTQLSASKRVRLWQYLCKLFNNKLENIIRHIYITDACKCNDNQNEVVWNKYKILIISEEFLSLFKYFYHGFQKLNTTIFFEKAKLKEIIVILRDLFFSALYQKYLYPQDFENLLKIKENANQFKNFLKLTHLTIIFSALGEDYNFIRALKSKHPVLKEENSLEMLFGLPEYKLSSAIRYLSNETDVDNNISNFKTLLKDMFKSYIFNYCIEIKYDSNFFCDIKPNESKMLSIKILNHSDKVIKDTMLNFGIKPIIIKRYLL